MLLFFCAIICAALDFLLLKIFLCFSFREFCFLDIKKDAKFMFLI